MSRGLSVSVECICLRICVAPYRRNSREWLHSTVSASAQVRCKWRYMTNEVPMFGKAAPSSNSLAVVLTGVLSAEGAHPKLFSPARLLFRFSRGAAGDERCLSRSARQVLGKPASASDCTFCEPGLPDAPARRHSGRVGHRLPTVGRSVTLYILALLCFSDAGI